MAESEVPAQIAEARAAEQATGEVVSQETSYNLTTTAKIYEAFNNSFNITEACAYAGISRDTYYRWLKEFPQFAEGVEIAKQMPNRLAKQNITKALTEGDIGVSKWLLERRDDDFKSKGQLEVVPPGERSTEEKLKEFMDDTDDGAYPDTLTANAVGAEPATTPPPESGEEVAASPTDIS